MAPWTGKEFAERHNKKLKGAVADKAARQANAILRSGAPEGLAIATANKHADKEKTKMARLTAQTRAKIPTSKFAGPGRSYPVQDKAHAKAAIGLAAMHNAPNKAAITAKAQRVLKGGGEKGGPPAGTTKAKGGMASRFDRMGGKSGSSKY